MGELLWVQCGEWLLDIGLLPSNHPLARIEDLVYTLRDGVMLCNVLAALDSTSVDLKQVNLRPQMARCLCMKNIRIFLAACKTAFGMKESELFEATMLYDYTDFGRVVQTLSRLSRNTKVRKLSTLPGFPPSSEGGVSKACPEEEQIYKHKKFIL